jgi:hypothetical protein
MIDATTNGGALTSVPARIAAVFGNAVLLAAKYTFTASVPVTADTDTTPVVVFNAHASAGDDTVDTPPVRTISRGMPRAIALTSLLYSDNANPPNACAMR